jgi:hypothetical protein
MGKDAHLTSMVILTQTLTAYPTRPRAPPFRGVTVEGGPGTAPPARRPGAPCCQLVAAIGNLLKGLFGCQLSLADSSKVNFLSKTASEFGL